MSPGSLVAIAVVLIAMIQAMDPAHAADDRAIRIESIRGAESVSVDHGNAVREAGVGDALRPGDRVRTGADVTAVLTYPDGTRISLLSRSDFQLEEPDESLQFTQLNSGSLRGEVPRTKTADLPEQGRPPMRLILRTRTAVMGVRGTDFLAGVDPDGGGARFHTLEGRIEVASRFTDLLGGNGVAVSAGQMIETDSTGRLGPVRAGDPARIRDILERGANIAGASPARPVSTLEKGSGPANGDCDRSDSRWLRFAMGGLGAGDPPGSALGAYWTPTFLLTADELVFLRGSFGLLHGLSQGGDGELVSVVETLVLIGSTRYRPFFVEAGGGGQQRSPSSSLAPAIAFQCGVILESAGFLDRVFVGSSRTLGRARQTDLRFGLAFRVF